MPDNPELIDKYEAELKGLLTRMHTDGIRPEAVHFVLRQALNKNIKGNRVRLLS